LHGSDIESHKTKVTDLTTQLETAQGQLTEANTTIEGFKKLKPEELQAAADDYKAKWEQAQTDAKTQLAQVKFEHALESALTGAKAKNPKAVKALLDMEVLQKAYDEKTGTIVNFDTHLKPVKEANDYLFEGETKPPVIVKGGGNKPVHMDPLEAGLLKGAKLAPENQEG
jgi:hypothetical protein